MTAAEKIIAAFHGPNGIGGARHLAKALGISPDNVYRWSYPKSRRGGDGNIPSHWHKPILEAAKERNIKIKPSDLVNS